jgi:stage IV sporulation protein B
LSQRKKTGALFLFLILAFSFTLTAFGRTVIPGGDAVAMRLECGGAIVLGFTDEERDNPGRRAGLKRGDRITGIGDSAVESADGLTAALNLCGTECEIRFTREEKEMKASVSLRSGKEGSGRLGVLVKDSAAGIGTLTFLLPEGGYGCLGHGITDSDTERLFPTERGVLFPARITAVHKGAAGSPGELQGMFVNPALGTALKNTETGLYGTLDPTKIAKRATVETAEKSEIREGPATVRCTVDEEGIREYDVEIVRIYRLFGGNTKNMLVRITDPELLEKTGGIVQGMSGSPLFQNGKLIGAITHVLVNNPAEGYGIFIENMLNAAEMPMQRAV